jgi:malonyl-CoA O-methyltransferase
MRIFEATNQLKSENSHSSRSIILDPEPAFELWAEVYDDSPNPIVQRSERAIIEKLPDLRGLRVADLACGTGRLLTQLFHFSPKTYVGVDLSNAMLQKGRFKEEVAGRLIQANLYDLPLQSGSMDLVTFSLGLSYFRSLIRVVQEIQRVLKPGGRVLCTDFHPTASELGWKRSFKIQTDQYEVCHFPHTVREVGLAFGNYFRLGCILDLFFGEAERVIFESAGKSSLFEEFGSQAALILFEWEKPAVSVCTGFNKSSDSSC